MIALPMATTLAIKKPTVILKHLDDFSNRHDSQRSPKRQYLQLYSLVIQPTSADGAGHIVELRFSRFIECDQDVGVDALPSVLW